MNFESLISFCEENNSFSPWYGITEIEDNLDFYWVNLDSSKERAISRIEKEIFDINDGFVFEKRIGPNNDVSVYTNRGDREGFCPDYVTLYIASDPFVLIRTILKWFPHVEKLLYASDNKPFISVYEAEKRLYRSKGITNQGFSSENSDIL